MAKTARAAFAVFVLGWALAGAAHGQGAVSVLGGGAAQDCSNAAIDGRSDDAAMKACNNAIDFEIMSRDDRGATFINRGVLKMYRRLWPAALTDFNDGLRLRPAAGEGWANRGGALLGVTRYKEAIDSITKGLELGLKQPEKAYYNRALAYEFVDDEKSAYFDYKKALELKPGWDLPQKELQRFSVTQSTPGP